jgi:hypothetical protein
MDLDLRLGEVYRQALPLPCLRGSSGRRLPLRLAPFWPSEGADEQRRSMAVAAGKMKGYARKRLREEK